jgi:hypothetical protein
MKNILFNKTLISRKDSVDGETPFQLCLTEEVNGFAVFTSGYSTGTTLIKFFSEGERDKAIEWAVNIAPGSKAVEDLLVKELREPTPQEIAN